MYFYLTIAVIFCGYLLIRQITNRYIDTFQREIMAHFLKKDDPYKFISVKNPSFIESCHHTALQELIENGYIACESKDSGDKILNQFNLTMRGYSYLNQV